jgi:hypothetical protein
VKLVKWLTMMMKAVNGVRSSTGCELGFWVLLGELESCEVEIEGGGCGSSA